MKLDPIRSQLGFIKDALALTGCVAALVAFQSGLVPMPLWFTTYMLVLVILFDGVFTIFPRLRIMTPFKATPQKVIALIVLALIGVAAPLLITAALSGDFMGFFSFSE